MTTEPQPTPAAAPLPGATIGADVPQAEPGPQAPAPGNQPPPVPGGQPPAATLVPPHRLKRTRISGLWVALGFFAVVLLLLLIFILQNGTKVDISYMGAHGHLPLGVALLLSAVCGVLLVILAGAARISQLRTTARRHRRADVKAAKQAAAPTPPASPAR
jgi:putative membrane protein